MIVDNAVTGRVLSQLLAWYVLSVRNTARLTLVPPDAFDMARAEVPAIFTFWHGLAMMTPLAIPPEVTALPMIARNAAAGIIADAVATKGMRSIRASGSHKVWHARKKGGAAGVRQSLRELAAGNSLLITADVPKIAQVAGKGVIHLARMSGRPIIPIAYVSRRGLRFNNWDRMVVDLPFSSATLRYGEPMRIAPDADDETVEKARLTLTEELDRITRDAYEREGIADKFKPGPSANG